MIRDLTRRYIGALQSLAPTPRETSFYRSVKLDRAASILSTIWSEKTGGRYNRKGEFEALYISDTPQTALIEVESMLRDAAGRIKGTRFAPRTIVTIDVKVSRSLSLADPAIRAALGVSETDLYEPWRVEQLNGPTITQQLGAAARSVGIEGLIVPSEKNRGATNAVVFPDILRVGSEVSIYGADGSFTTTTIKGRIPVP